MAACDQEGLVLGVVLLAAGASSRMGRPKLLLPWGRTSIIGHIIAEWQFLGASQIAVVYRPEDRVLGAELERLQIPSESRITNPHPEHGMFGSIRCAANHEGWRDEVNAWAVVLGDQPHLRAETLRRLIAFHGARLDAICEPIYAQRRRHPVLLPPAAFAALRDSPAETFKEFLQQTTVRRRACAIDDPGLDFDLDTPGDYERAVARQAQF